MFLPTVDKDVFDWKKAYLNATIGLFKGSRSIEVFDFERMTNLANTQHGLLCFRELVSFLFCSHFIRDFLPNY